MKETIKNLVTDALRMAKEKGGLELSVFPDVIIEEPKDKKMGDFATTVAMLLAKSEKKNPRVIAEAICGELQSDGGLLESAKVAGPGFINIKMSKDFFIQRLLKADELGEKFGESNIGNNQKVLLEFVSANPTGPLHVGHGRGAAVGHMLSCVLKKAGYDVSTEYYINDVGNQMNTLGRSTWLRYQELLGNSVDFPKDCYQGDYVKDIAQKIIDDHGKEYADKNTAEVLPFFRKFSFEMILDEIKSDLKEFRVEFDCWFSEQSLYDDNSVEKGVAWLKDKGYTYEKDGALWIKSSAFNDDKDRVVIKKDGEKTYFCSDIAYHKNKIDRGFEKLIDLWGADHHGYVPRMRAVLEAMGYGEDVFNVLLVQFVSLLRKGKKVSMSTRSGEFDTLAEVVREVGVDATRFFFLMRSSDSHLDFDLELAKEESPENPVYYIQYAHARICNIFRKAEEKGVAWPPSSKIDLSVLQDDDEFILIKKILSFTECVEKSAQTLEPHRVPFYLQELVAIFHSYYAKHRVVSDDKALTLARLLLLDCLRIVIKNGLDLMSVSAPDRM